MRGPLAAPLHAILMRFVDLERIIKDHVYHPTFAGSFSLKKVVPALLPGVSYDGLPVADGDNAIALFARMARGELADVTAARQQLLAYCKMDTCVMVKLHEILLPMTISPPTPSVPPPPFTHNAHRLLVNLRAHLARHDKPIAFLLGAGTSCSVQVPCATNSNARRPLIPAVEGLTDLCESAAFNLGAKYKASWTQMRDQCLAAGAAPTVEALLSRLHMMLKALGPSDTLTGLTLPEVERLESCVRATIATTVTPPLEDIPDHLPHSHLGRWIASAERKHPIEIFTVNYDILLELALERERVPIFDGFVGTYQPFFHADSLRRSELAPGPHWTRLWKMHGSVTWRRLVFNGRPRIVRGPPDPSGEMVFPSLRKYDESRQQPYLAFMDRFANFLNLDDALLIVAGFGFGDDHINDLIFSALETHPRTHVYALQYLEPEGGTALIDRGLQRDNIIIVGPETGVIGGQRARWAAGDDNLVVDGAFELVSHPSIPGLRLGGMKIGDFAAFCKFLTSLTARG